MNRRIALTTLVVADYDEAIAWYTGKLGFQLIEDIDQGSKRWVVVGPADAGSAALLLARASNDEQRSRIGNQTGGRVGFFLNTDDFQRDHAAMLAAGVEFLEAPRHEPYATVAVFRDLYGNTWDLLEPARMKTLVLASHNAGKLEEMQQILADLPLRITSAAELALGDVEETGLTFVENALLKARAACEATGLPALADDSGLIVDALGGAPGLYSARYAGSPTNAAANNAKLLEAMADIPDGQRSARFYAVIVLLRHAHDPQPLICEGRWEGQIIRETRGSNGFGYNPVFLDTTHGLTAAEMEPAMKNAISHRALALQLLKQQLASWL